eukprot:TRINITY_DN887_c0_g1_i1.p2 TRINITY_DN887_c0_g1~~TRINITY_DN887_c0_g1_i1.p2  ORF type:complete len:127 (+),score=12.40 TRINITY_DN887_c0_g1_i1:173-553(+)
MARTALLAFALLAILAVCHARPAPFETEDISDNSVAVNTKNLARQQLQALVLTDLAAWDEEDNAVGTTEGDKIAQQQDNSVSASVTEDSDNSVAANAAAADEDNSVAVAEPADSDNSVAVTEETDS